MLFKPPVWIALITISLVTDPAFAQIPNNALDQVLVPFSNFMNLAQNVRDLAIGLFYSLMLIEFIYSASLLIWGGGDLGSFGKFMVQRVFIMGVSIYIFNSADAISTVIRVTFGSVSNAVGGVAPNPANILETGINLAADLSGTVSWWNASKAIPILITGLALVFIFSLIAGNMVLVLAELYLMSTIGLILLGFLGSSLTRDYAIGYFRYVISVCFKLLAMQVLVFLGFNVVNGWINALQPDDIRNASLFALVGTMLVFYQLSNTLPNAAADLIRGQTSGGFGGVGSSSVINSMRSAASSLKNATTNLVSSSANLAMASKAATQLAKKEGNTGAAIVSGAAANMAKATKQEVGKSMRGVNGPMSQRQSMSQRINSNLSGKANRS